MQKHKPIGHWLMHYVAGEPTLWEPYKDWLLSLYRHDDNNPQAKRKDETCPAFAKRRLGEDSYRIAYDDRQYWVWEGPTWRLFVLEDSWRPEMVVPNGFNWKDKAAVTALAKQSLDDLLAAWGAVA